MPASRRVFVSPMVVGQNVMLTVATSDAIVGPTRLLFPKAMGGVGEAADFPFSLLGLGDVAVPGEAARAGQGGGRRAAWLSPLSHLLGLGDVAVPGGHGGGVLHQWWGGCLPGSCSGDGHVQLPPTTAAPPSRPPFSIPSQRRTHA